MKRKEKWKKFCDWIFSGFVEVFRSGFFTWVIILVQFVIIALYTILQDKITQKEYLLQIIIYFLLVRSSCRLTACHIACRSYIHRDPDDKIRHIYRRRAVANFTMVMVFTFVIVVIMLFCK